MEISAQLVSVFNTLAEKFGIVIDWGSKNVLPYLQDLCGRIINYEIVTSILWVVFAAVLFVIGVFVTKCCSKREKTAPDYDPVKVRLNIKRIHGQFGWRKRRQDYRDFVNNNKNTVFTAIKRSDQLIELADENGRASGWLFWQTDLVLLEE